MDDASPGPLVVAERDRGLTLAGWRLERALSRLEARVAEHMRRAEAQAAALAAAQARARDLEGATVAAADALDRALDQIRALQACRGSAG